MVNDAHLGILNLGVDAWNHWREAHPDIRPVLTQANLSGASLSGANFSGAELVDVTFSSAELRGADLSDALLVSTDFTNADLSDANLTNANLIFATLSEAYLFRSDFSKTRLFRTVLADINLSTVKGLETCEHHGPSIINHQTLVMSGQLPRPFLRGVGLPDNYIEYLQSLVNEPIQFYSCFISYSHKDGVFANQLHADLQDKGVPCWIDKEDLRLDTKLRDGIDEAVRRHDKLLLILSENSINSQWVEQEVETALEKEQQQDQLDPLILFPIRLDDAAMNSKRGWVNFVKRRPMADFTNWENHDAYQKELERLLRSLKPSLEST